MTNVIINTNRLLLKGMSPQVIHELFSTKNEEEVKAFLGTGEPGYLHYKEMHEKGMETHRLSLFFFLLIEKETGQPIGECGFHTWNQAHRRAELFYSLRADAHKRKGYMTEALEQVIKYGFDTMQLNRIEALVAKDNIPSLKLLKQHNFVFEGTMRQDYVVNDNNEDSECYSLLKGEWAGAATDRL